MKGLRLQRGIIYGPVFSRRLGRSLGINILSQKCKWCSFDCVYCDYGRTDVHSIDPGNLVDELPSPSEVESALRSFLKKHVEVDFITFSGNGEPTLHPLFPEIVNVVKEVRDDLVPHVKLAILSNASTLSRKSIRKAVLKLDAPIMKLDAGSEKFFHEVNRPCKDVSFNEVLNGLKNLGNVIIQTMLFKGKISNVNDEALNLLIKRLREIKPRYVQVYTVDRPPAEPQIRKISETRLSEVAYRIREEVGVPARVYALKCPKCGSENLSYVVLPSGEQFYECRCGYRRKAI
ncbi:MAG: radical SAM protein [Candidatus Baldrarchaeia archaeon]